MLDEELLDVLVAVLDVDVVEAVEARIDVTAVYIDCASDSSELKRSPCAVDRAASDRTTSTFCGRIVKVSHLQMLHDVVIAIHPKNTAKLG